MADKLSDFDLFESVSDEFINLLQENVSVKTLKSEQELFAQDQPADKTFYIVLSGTILIRKDMRTKMETVMRMEEGEPFGELGYFRKNHRRAAAAIAKGKTEVVKVSRQTMSVLRSKYPGETIKFYENLFEVMSNRFVALAQKAEKTRFWL